MGHLGGGQGGAENSCHAALQSASYCCDVAAASGGCPSDGCRFTSRALVVHSSPRVCCPLPCSARRRRPARAMGGGRARRAACAARGWARQVRRGAADGLQEHGRWGAAEQTTFWLVSPRGFTHTRPLGARRSLPRVGLCFGAPSSLQHVQWYGRGPHECYPGEQGLLCCPVRCLAAGSSRTPAHLSTTCSLLPLLPTFSFPSTAAPLPSPSRCFAQTARRARRCAATA